MWHLKACGALWVIETRGIMGKCLKAQAKGTKAEELQAASTVGDSDEEGLQPGGQPPGLVAMREKRMV